jgi:hypothetical protein
MQNSRSSAFISEVVSAAMNSDRNDKTFRPDDLPPPPRAVRRRAGHGWFIGCTHLFILPHTLGGIFLLGLLAVTVAGLVSVTFFGSEIPGRIVELQARKGKRGTNYYVSYRYQVGDSFHQLEVPIDADGYQTLQKDAAITVRVLMTAPIFAPQLLVPGVHPWREAAGIVFAALFWNGIMSVFLWTLYVEPWRLRRLVKLGTPTTGVITGKEVRRGKNTSWIIKFDYQAPIEAGPGMEFLGSTTMKSKMSVREADFQAAEVGDQVTVLYHPLRPRRALIYRFADYEAVV